MATSIYDLLSLCTVKIAVVQSGSSGTGFFVADCRVVTCAHVLKGHADSTIAVTWQGKTSETVRVIEIYQGPIDLALLNVEFSPQMHPPCVFLDEAVNPFDRLYAYGYSDYFPNGSSITVRCEGKVNENNTTLIKVQAGQVRPGHSGPPALNNETGKVRGLISQTRNRSTDLGGFLIPTTVIFTYFPNLRTLNQETATQTQQWLKILSSHLNPDGGEVLKTYLAQESKRHAFMKLPLLNHRGRSISLPIEKLYVDLPLMLNYAPLKGRQATAWIEVEDTQWMLRDSFTSALLYDRAVRLYVSQEEEESDQIQSQLRSSSRIVITGDPGCGKTTLLSYLARTCIVQKRWTPITLTCRDLLGMHQVEGLLGLVRYQLQQLGYSQKQVQVLSDVLEQQIAANQVLLLVDGLDEIPTETARQRLAKFLSAQAQLYPEMPMILTSRVVGFRAIQSVLDRFKHFTVAPLSVNHKKRFVELWASLVSEISGLQNSADIRKRLENLVCKERKVAKLCENIFLLGLIAQMFSFDRELPAYRTDVYRRALELMIVRQRKGQGLPLTVNEVYPYLEHLAYCMRLEGDQYWPETRVIEAIEEVRRAEIKESDLQRRSPGEWLDAAINQLGILNIAGPSRIDHRGYERRMIQFFHQSFQEYFAAQAIIHSRGDYNRSVSESGVGILEQLNQQVNRLNTVERKIESFRSGIYTEPVAAGQWQEVVRFCISELSSYKELSSGLPNSNYVTADDALLLLLPKKDATSEKARALSVFALQCLVEAPKLKDETVRAVFESAVHNFREFDGADAKRNTLMDEAVYAVGQSSYGPQWHSYLLMTYIQTKNAQRSRVGCVLVTSYNEELSKENAAQVLILLLNQITVQNPLEARVSAGLKLTELFYKKHNSSESLSLDFLSEELLRKTIKTLLYAAVERPAGNAVSTAAMWALGWITSARSGNPYTLYKFTQVELATLRVIISDTHQDTFSRSWAAEILSVCSPDETVVGQTDWMYEWAVVADGERPHCLLPKTLMTASTQDIRAIETLLSPNLPVAVRFSGAISLGRLGYFDSQMVDPLLEVFENDLYDWFRRNEALVYLVFLEEPKIISTLMDGLETHKNVDKIYDFSERCFLALIGTGNVDILRKLIDTNSNISISQHLDACACTLAGVQSNEGRKALKSMLSHHDAEVRYAAALGLSKAMMWGLFKKMSPGDQVSMRISTMTYKITQWPLSKALFSKRSYSASEVSYVDKQIANRGSEIHKIKAKDSTGHWAYYFVLVEQSKERRFLAALDSSQTIDLENYGKVIASCYGEEPSEKLKKFLREKYGFIV